MTHKPSKWLQFAHRFQAFSFALIVFSIMLPSLSAQDVAVRPRDTDDSQRLRFIKAAQEYLGVPYLSGGTTAQGMDCSGFVYRAAQDGLDAQFPRTVSSLSRH